jgi:hypothetical protein
MALRVPLPGVSASGGGLKESLCKLFWNLRDFRTDIRSRIDIAIEMRLIVWLRHGAVGGCEEARSTLSLSSDSCAVDSCVAAVDM